MRFKKLIIKENMCGGCVYIYGVCVTVCVCVYIYRYKGVYIYFLKV